MSAIPGYSSQLAVLTQARNNICGLIQTLTSQLKPDYAINGQSVQWAHYLVVLTDNLEKMNKQIQVAGGPFELQTQMMPSGSAGAGYGSGPF